MDHFNPQARSVNDYYPFGMMQYARNYTELGSGNYRFGFNGKENDNEVKGDGDQIDYGMRIYDPRVGRFLSSDPLTQKYPWNSTYAYAENDVIRSLDLDGLEKYIVNKRLDEKQRVTLITVIRYEDVNNKAIDMDLKKDGKDVAGDGQNVLVRTFHGKSLTPSNVSLGSDLTPEEQDIATKDITVRRTVDDKGNNAHLYFNGEYTMNDMPANSEYLVSSKQFNYPPPRPPHPQRPKQIVPTFNNQNLVPGTTISNFSGNNAYFFGGGETQHGGELQKDLTDAIGQLAVQLHNTPKIKEVTVNINQWVGLPSDDAGYEKAQQYGGIKL